MFSLRFVWVNRLGLAIVLAVALLVVTDRTGVWPLLRPVTGTLYQWMILLGAFTLLLGIANVVRVHWQRVQQGEEEWPLSLLLVLSLATVFVLGLLSPSGTTGLLVEWVFDSVIAPGQATLFALTAFFVVAAAYRFLRVGQPGSPWILAAALLTLAVQAPLTQTWLHPILLNFADWLLTWPVMAALRGALLGAGLAAVLAGLRLFMGAE